CSSSSRAHSSRWRRRARATRTCSWRSASWPDSASASPRTSSSAADRASPGPEATRRARGCRPAWRHRPEAWGPAAGRAPA
ncbi:MAG: hypothetical protein AVDCRST_MAG79-594, partial [uncultured Thermoleophilia bacterium]